MRRSGTVAVATAEETAGRNSRQTHADVPPIPTAAVPSALQVVASLLWIPQAGLLSAAAAEILAGGPGHAVLWQAGVVLGLGIARSVLDAFGGRIAFRQARAFLSDHRARVVDALSRRSPLDSVRPTAGLAASTLVEQAEAITPYLARFRPARQRAMIVPPAILLCVLAYSWAAALVLLLAAPLIPIFMALIGWRAKTASEAQLAQLGGMNAFLLDRLRGLATIHSLDAVETTALRLKADSEALRARTMAVLRIAFLSSAVLELFAALGIAMVAVYVGFHLLGQLPFGAWGGQLTLGSGLFILLLAPAFFEPQRELSTVWHDRAAGEAAFEALDRLAGTGAELPGGSHEQPSHASIASTAPVVRIENLRFRYASRNETVFDNLCLDVAPGEHVALLAESGRGKSTLLALLAGLTIPGSGRILIDGEEFSAGTAARMRRRIAWIGQHPHIFAGTLASNVTLRRTGSDPASIREALRCVGLEEVAEKRGHIPIGENGVGISGGEASRLALARIAVRPEVGLILADEPTAHLDAATARGITDALLSLARGRTLIVATHDAVLAARMDRIIRLAPTPLQEAA